MRRLTVLAFAVALVSLAACGSDDNGPPTGLATRTIEAGEVTVEIGPLSIDDRGAAFEIVMDTHSVELDMDIAKDASLEVGGEDWTDARWKGDGPSGHHREGTLSFDAGGPANGTARLELGGFDASVVAEWVLTG